MKCKNPFCQRNTSYYSYFLTAVEPPCRYIYLYKLYYRLHGVKRNYKVEKDTHTVIYTTNLVRQYAYILCILCLLLSALL